MCKSGLSVLTSFTKKEDILWHGCRLFGQCQPDFNPSGISGFIALLIWWSGACFRLRDELVGISADYGAAGVGGFAAVGADARAHLVVLLAGARPGNDAPGAAREPDLLRAELERELRRVVQPRRQRAARPLRPIGRLGRRRRRRPCRSVGFGFGTV